ncbi:MAG: Cell division integral membrane protein, YggT and half-length relatives, partial [uncultured Ramlibacter sp.]
GLSNRFVSAERCRRPARRRLPPARVHAVPAGAVRQSDRPLRLRLDRLGGAAAAQGAARRAPHRHGQRGCRLAGRPGSTGGAAGAPRRRLAGAAAAGVARASAPAGFVPDRAGDHLRDPVVGARGLARGRRDRPPVRTAAAAVPARDPAGGRDRPVAAGLAGRAAGDLDADRL